MVILGSSASLTEEIVLLEELRKLLDCPLAVVTLQESTSMFILVVEWDECCLLCKIGRPLNFDFV